MTLSQPPTRRPLDFRTAPLTLLRRSAREICARVVGATRPGRRTLKRPAVYSVPSSEPARKLQKLFLTERGREPPRNPRCTPTGLYACRQATGLPVQRVCPAWIAPLTIA